MYSSVANYLAGIFNIIWKLKLIWPDPKFFIINQLSAVITVRPSQVYVLGNCAAKKFRLQMFGFPLPLFLSRPKIRPIGNAGILCSTEAEFLDVNGTKIVRVFHLAIHNHFY
jgi:hypothetical protein